MKTIITLMVILSTLIVNAQTSKDTLKIIYKNYFDLLQTKEKLDTIAIRVENFEDLMKSNNQKIKEIFDAELFDLKTQLEHRKKIIINTTEFVFASNASLNAIKQLDATSDYMTQISSLNNPDNSDLGFSLSEEITSIVSQKILKDNNKVNGIKKDKFLVFIDNIVKSPILKTLTNAVPVVSSIKSVVELVMASALTGNDITIDDIKELKTSLKVYLEHYEGLVKAQTEFEQNLNNLDIRKEALILLLTQYTIERVNTISPKIINEQDRKLTLTSLINKRYLKSTIQQKIDEIISNNPTDYNLHLNNKSLRYPNYALNQAKFIRDEIESLSKEYVSILTTYQLSLEDVLRKSKNIGDTNKIDMKINDLKTKLTEVKITFSDNINTFKLNDTFNILMQY